jgi:homoserine kinase type II
MSVYTKVERGELEQFLQGYPLGPLVGFEGIRAGIENTNYFVTTAQGEYVLTLFEWLSAAELPYFLDLMAFLAEHGIPSAHPLADNQHHYLRHLNGKPAALVQRLQGRSIEAPAEKHCAAIGAALGRMHRIGLAFPLVRANNRGPAWWRATANKLTGKLSLDDEHLLQDEIRFQAQFQSEDLPRGVVHADLFRDNALFVGEQLTGIIDFYYACNDVLLYDVAVTVNDWCSLGDGTLDMAKAGVMLRAYRDERPWTDAEQPAWPVMLRAAALRFWVSRLHDLHFPRPGEITHTKDPNEFKRILLQRREQKIR